MTFGRPTMITNTDDVPLPAMIDDEYLSKSSKESLQPPNKPSRLGMFVYSCKLFDLLKEMLNFVSSKEVIAAIRRESKIDQSDRGEVVAQVLNLTRKLDQFSESVPPYLRISSESSMESTESHVQLQQRVLYCRCGFHAYRTYT